MFNAIKSPCTTTGTPFLCVMEPCCQWKVHPVSLMFAINGCLSWWWTRFDDKQCRTTESIDNLMHREIIYRHIIYHGNRKIVVSAINHELSFSSLLLEKRSNHFFRNSALLPKGEQHILGSQQQKSMRHRPKRWLNSLKVGSKMCGSLSDSSKPLEFNSCVDLTKNNPDWSFTNNVLFVKIEGPVTGIPSIIIYPW